MKNMHRLMIPVLFFLWGIQICFGQVGIGTANPNASAQLDVSANNRGILVPRVSIGNVFLASPVASPAEGLLVWNTNTSVSNGQGVGFYYWTGTRWQKLTNISEGWSLFGNNVDTAIHFIGTTSNSGLMFRVGNQKAGGIFPFGGNTFLGAKAGRFLKLDSETFTGENNTFFGSDAGESQRTGNAHTFIGARAGVNSQAGFGNTFVGYQSGAGNGNGSNNTAIGIGAGNNGGSRNVAIGSGAGSSLGNGIENIVIGSDVGSFLIDDGNAPAYGNVWIGNKAATGNFGFFPKRQSVNNVIIGDSAATKVNGAIANVFVGKRSGMNSVNGQFNVFIGDSSGINNSGGQRNTYMGSKARGNNPNRINATAIGANAEAGADNVVVLGSINGINGATSSANIGIGTTTPGAKLHVVNGTSTGVNFSGNSSLVLDRAGGSNHLSMLVDANSEAALIFGKVGSAQPPFDGGIFYNTGGTGTMQFRNAAGITRMIIHNNGNVSIGANNSSARLWLAPAAASGIAPINNSSLVLDGGAGLQYLSMLSTGVEQGLIFGTNQGNSDGAVLYSQSNRRMSFRTAGTSNRMVIDDLGRVGVGSATPDFRLHVVSSDSQNFGYLEGIMIENIATGLDGNGNINTGEAAISFKNAGANGTGVNQWIVGLNQNRNLAFAYGDQFAGGTITKMLLDSTGNLGIGTTSPSQKLHVIGNILASGTIAPSDMRYKKNFSSLGTVLPMLMAIQPMYYQYNKEAFPEMGFTDERTLGVMAQELEVLFPELVVTDNKGYKAVDYSRLSVVLLRALQEQQQNMEQQEKIIDRQQTILDQMDRRLKILENQGGK